MCFVMNQTRSSPCETVSGCVSLFVDALLCSLHAFRTTEDSKRRQIEEEAETKAEADFVDTKSIMDANHHKQRIGRLTSAASSNSIHTLSSTNSLVSSASSTKLSSTATVDVYGPGVGGAAAAATTTSVTEGEEGAKSMVNGMNGNNNSAGASSGLANGNDPSSAKAVLNGSKTQPSAAPSEGDGEARAKMIKGENGMPDGTRVRTLEIERAVGEVPTARMPGPLYTHYVLRSAGAGGSSAGGAGLPQLAVSKQAVEMLDVGARVSRWSLLSSSSV